MYSLCNESITGHTLIVEQHSMKHAAALSELSVEEKSEDIKKMFTEKEKQRGSLQKCVSHGQHSKRANFVESLCMGKPGKPFTSEESLKKTVGCCEELLTILKTKRIY